MKTDLKEILVNLPDFDELSNLAHKIREASVKKLMIEKDIKRAEAKVVSTVVGNSAWFRDGKPLAMSVIESTYKYTGLEGEIIPLREQYIESCGELDELRLTMDIYKNMFDVWRTLSANERSLNI
jgi:hypothetical protein